MGTRAVEADEVPPHWDSATRAKLRRAALGWFREHARDLPWRRSRDPYRVWLSEVMLQQTQVATVVGYFERFIAAFPTVRELAAADEAQVLRLWEGLGYYRRARQLHAAARRVVECHGAEFPRDAASLRDLPGIGRYTAGAIASIAFDAREPILEANTIRLLARLTAERGDVTTGGVQARLWQAATELLPTRDVGLLNQALMELGALVCTPRTPNCGECPLARWCQARAEGGQAELPFARPKAKIEAVQEAVVVVRDRGRVLVRQCQPGERWAGLWDFPRFSLAAPPHPVPVEELQRKTADQTGVAIEPGKLLAVLRHGVTRFRITLHCFEAQRVTGQTKKGQAGRSPLNWLRPKELEDVPLSVTGRRIGRLLVDS